MPASILAEPRRKQKISIDPQNQTWKKDSEKFGHKLMEKMGWQDGKGLGIKEQGITDNIRLQPNYTARGLGSEPINHDKTWMAHHDDFAQILAQLNKDKLSENTDTAESKQVSKFSIESKSKESRSRIHYHRFTRGKDLSRLCDNQQKSAILGGDVSKEKSADESSNGIKHAELPLTGNITVSKMSMNDYFASKIKRKSEIETADITLQATSESPSNEPKEEEPVISANDEEVLSKVERRKRKETRRLDKKKRKLDMAVEKQGSQTIKDENSD